jgi:hypothetical protein
MLEKAANKKRLNIAVHGQKQNILNGITIRPDIVIEKKMKHLMIPNGRT